MKLNILLVAIIVLGLFFVGCSSTDEKGLLQGNVLIGPITPVEQPGQDAVLRCDIYDARKIMIYDKSGTELVMQVDIECNQEENYTRYRVELEPGIYTVDINSIGIDYSDDVPKQVEIKSGITFKLDIEIDTGIR
ncbi:MAG: hypothetical protein JSV77_05970 [Dehalococcoidales bacterium]|nr:MAG: hypothetical protein JSV77_05970 [Dehalococcoidales bacterium]